MGECFVKQCVQPGEFLIVLRRSVQQTSPCTLERIYIIHIILLRRAPFRQAFDNKQLQGQANLIEILNLAKVVLLNRVAPIGQLFDEPIRRQCPEGLPHRTTADAEFLAEFCFGQPVFWRILPMNDPLFQCRNDRRTEI